MLDLTNLRTFGKASFSRPELTPRKMSSDLGRASLVLRMAELRPGVSQIKEKWRDNEKVADCKESLVLLTLLR